MTKRRSLRARLDERLRAMGIDVVEGIDVPRGYWAHEHQDVQRWTTRARIDGQVVPIGSFDSLAECVRRDRRLTLTPPTESQTGDWEVHVEPLNATRAAVPHIPEQVLRDAILAEVDRCGSVLERALPHNVLVELDDVGAVPYCARSREQQCEMLASFAEQMQSVLTSMLVAGDLVRDGSAIRRYAVTVTAA